MGLRPVLGRLINSSDDGPNAAGAVVLTHRFWTTALQSDPSVIGKTVRLDSRVGTIVGVLEPTVPYPQETEIIANVVTSPHHMSATMVTGRVHRMTELFGRLAPGATVESARAELQTAHGAMVREHPEDYSAKSDFRIDAVQLRDQIISPARTILLVLLAASALVFVIACSNVANLILARSVRREGELAVRAALGARTSALRRTLLAESLLAVRDRRRARSADGEADGRGAVAVRRALLRAGARRHRRCEHALDRRGPRAARRNAARLRSAAAVGRSVERVRSLEWQRTADDRHESAAAVCSPSCRSRRRSCSLPVPECCSPRCWSCRPLNCGSTRATCSRCNVPVISGQPPEQVTSFYNELLRRITALPGVERVAIGTLVPWREAGAFGPGFQFSAEGYAKVDGEEDPRGRFRTISPGFFDALGVQFRAGRDFNDADRRDSEMVVIISESLAQRMFPGRDPAQSPHLRGPIRS